MANLTYGGTDLSVIGGFETPELSGLLDLVGVEQAETWLPGRDAPALTDIRRRFPDLRVKCCLKASDDARATFLGHLAALKQALSPARGPQFLTRTDFPGKRLLCQSLGFPGNEDTLPYIMAAGEFALSFRRLGFWEDETPTEVNIAYPSGTVSNTGDLEAVPTYICTATGALPSGVTFTVVGSGYTYTFSYTGSLAAGDVLVVDTDLCAVTKNGGNAIGNVATTSDFPRLPVGTTTVSVSSSLFGLKVTFRRRWE